MGSTRSRSALRDRINSAINQRRLRRALSETAQPASTSGKTAAGISIALLAMQATPVSAVGLGEIQLRSGLGQPLRATVPVTIGNGETVRSNCVQTVPQANRQLKEPPGISVKTPTARAAGTYELRIETASPLYEPMYELSLRVDCPGTALLVRQYVLMLDLPGIPNLEVEAATNSVSETTDRAAPVQIESTAATPARANRSRNSIVRSTAKIAAGTDYRVQSGDTLSTIAARIEGRPANATWDVAMQIFARNSEAFIRSNPDMIKLGKTISIPTVAEMQLAAGIAVIDAGTPSAPAPDPRPAERPVEPALTRETEIATPAPAPAVTVVDSLPTTPQADISDRSAPPVSPFVDESQTVAPAVPPESPATPEASATEPVTAVETVVSIGEESDGGGFWNTLIAIVMGVLLGAALSVLLVRSGIFKLFASVFGRREAAPPQQATPMPDEADTFNEFDASVSDFQGATMNDFDDSAADAAFATDPGVDTDATPVQLGTPHEETYIVEVSEAEQTASEQQQSGEQLFAPSMTQGVADSIEELPAPALDPSLSDIESNDVDLLIDADNTPDVGNNMPDDTVLASLFDDAFNPAAQPDDDLVSSNDELERTDNQPGANLEPTAEMPAGELEPTAEMPGAALEPTAEMPAGNLDPTTELPAANLDPTTELPTGDFDPTAEMPAQSANPIDQLPDDFVDPAQIIDPTAEPTPADRTAQMSMTQSFSENLERLDLDRAANEESKADEEDLRATDTMRVLEGHPDPASTAEMNLDELVKSAEEDESLSQTLHEALSLLERDYEDEFTASQILERAEIEKALEEEDDETLAARKISK